MLTDKVRSGLAKAGIFRRYAKYGGKIKPNPKRKTALFLGKTAQSYSFYTLKLGG
jgi:hypothetical protein